MQWCSTTTRVVSCKGVYSYYLNVRTCCVRESERERYFVGNELCLSTGAGKNNVGWLRTKYYCAEYVLTYSALYKVSPYYISQGTTVVTL